MLTFKTQNDRTSLAADRQGIAAVEFALLAPLMILLYVGVIDVTRGVIASRKLNLLSRTISDLVSQQPTSLPVPISKLSTILSSATAIMQPYPITSLKLTVSAVSIQQVAGAKTPTCCDVVVNWSYTQAGDKTYLRPCKTTLAQVADGTAPSLTTFPKSLVTANAAQGFGYVSGSVSYVIVTDASYVYTPIFNQAVSWFTGGMQKTTYMVPRAPANGVTIASPSTATAPQLGCSS